MMYKYCAATVLAAVLALCGCSDGSDSLAQREGRELVSVMVEASTLTDYSTRPLADNGHPVDRVLVLPFRKIDEGVAANLPDNFAADFTAARQFNIDASPSFYSLLELAPERTWTVLLLGYSETDYDHTNPGAPGARFVFGPEDGVITLEDVYLRPVNAGSVPGFFSAQCLLYSDDVLVGEYFRLADNTSNKLRGTLKRMVSGLEVKLENVPPYVSSVAVGADRLVRASAPLTGDVVLPAAEGESTGLIVGRVVPHDGRAVVSTVLLPAFGGHETGLFIDISFYGDTERHVVKLPDTPGLVTGNRVAFRPNELVSISGDYESLDVGFHVTGTIGLDDDEWDGLH